jgi:hypothetical protein
VRAMDARNRHRFRNDQQVLGAWITASTVRARSTGQGPAETRGPAPGGESETGSDVRPAA